ncbi:MAG: T9SS type A sorting domain-containing protein [Flavobacteriales bacterium]|nr:T9SS type A sorting domain-containing protein [Flavobacteriales bacterium]
MDYGYSIDETDLRVLLLAPNPATDHITLSAAAPLAGLQCDLVDDLGRVVISTSVPLDGRVELRTSAPGRYTILVHGRELILRSSFIKLP